MLSVEQYVPGGVIRYAYDPLAKLLRREGTLFIVTRRGKPVAQLGPNEQGACQPVFGSAKGRIHISDDFDEPLDDMAEYSS